MPCAARQVNVGHGKVESSDGEGTPKTNGSWENTMIGHLAGSFLPRFLFQTSFGEEFMISHLKNEFQFQE